MPIYESEEITREKLEEIRRRNVCAVCGEWLNMFLGEDGLAFVACYEWLRSHHDGIEREASRYEKEGLASLNIPRRREIMEQEYGKETTTALAKLPMTGALTQPQAMHILKLVYPGVPEDQIVRTAILCRDFGLHPLMKEVYIIGYKNTKTGKTDYSIVLGIAANRKLAADKKGAYSFLDDTPRAAAPTEILKQYGKDSEEERNNLISICKLKGEKGNEAMGFGLWPKNEEPKAKKGNTKRNMCNIRSERQALDRLPGEAIPLRHLDVIDEAYAEVPDIGKVNKDTGEIVEGEFEVLPEEKSAEKKTEETPEQHWCKEHNCTFTKKNKFGKDYWSHPLPDGKWCNEKKQKAAASQQAPLIPESTEELPSDEPEPAEPVEEPKGFIDRTFLKESLETLRAKKLSAWSESNLLAFMNITYKVEAKTVLEGAAQLDKGQAAHFVSKIQETLDMA